MTECNDRECTLEVSKEEANILRFTKFIQADKDLEFAGAGETDGVTTNAEPIITEDDMKYGVDDVFVLRDNRFDEGSTGAFPKMEVQEVMEKCSTDDRAKHIVGVLKGEENSTRLYGVSRIVGYYSRVNSWNKSKVGELRDRGKGVYKLDGGMTNSQERMEAISAL